MQNPLDTRPDATTSGRKGGTLTNGRESGPASAGPSVGASIGGAAVGAVLGGAAAGAATGTLVGGPVGTAMGAALGAIAGGLAGKTIAEGSIDPSAEDDYWRENYKHRPYADGTTSYDDYGPAYRYGVDAFGRHPGRSFEEAEPELSRNWGSTRGTSNLGWDRASHATRDAWNRVSDTVERAVPGDSDRDGK